MDENSEDKTLLLEDLLGGGGGDVDGDVGPPLDWLQLYDPTVDPLHNLQDFLHSPGDQRRSLEFNLDISRSASTDQVDDGGCSCPSCTQHSVLVQEIANEVQKMKDYWLQLKQDVRQVYSLVLTGGWPGQSPPDLEAMRMNIHILTNRDPHQLFTRLEALVGGVVLDLRDQLYSLLTKEAKSPKLAQDFLIMLLEFHTNLVEAARILAPVLHDLEVHHLRRFSLTWELFNKHLYQKGVYSDPIFQNNIPIFISTLRAQNPLSKQDEEKVTELVRSYLDFDVEMENVAAFWSGTQALLLEYSAEQQRQKERRKSLRSDYNRFKEEQRRKSSTLPPQGLLEEIDAENDDSPLSLLLSLDQLGPDSIPEEISTVLSSLPEFKEGDPYSPLALEDRAFRFDREYSPSTPGSTPSMNIGLSPAEEMAFSTIINHFISEGWDLETESEDERFSDGETDLEQNFTSKQSTKTRESPAPRPRMSKISHSFTTPAIFPHLYTPSPTPSPCKEKNPPIPPGLPKAKTKEEGHPLQSPSKEKTPPLPGPNSLSPMFLEPKDTEHQMKRKGSDVDSTKDLSTNLPISTSKGCETTKGDVKVPSAGDSLAPAPKTTIVPSSSASLSLPSTSAPTRSASVPSVISIEVPSQVPSDESLVRSEVESLAEKLTRKIEDADKQMSDMLESADKTGDDFMSSLSALSNSLQKSRDALQISKLAQTSRSLLLQNKPVGGVLRSSSAAQIGADKARIQSIRADGMALRRQKSDLGKSGSSQIGSVVTNIATSSSVVTNIATSTVTPQLPPTTTSEVKRAVRPTQLKLSKSYSADHVPKNSTIKLCANKINQKVCEEGGSGTCSCTYCQVFGGEAMVSPGSPGLARLPGSRNYPDIRDRLRSRLDKKKRGSKCSTPGITEEAVDGSQERRESCQEAAPSAGHVPAKVAKVCDQPPVTQPEVASDKSEKSEKSWNKKDVDQLLEFIEGNSKSAVNEKKRQKKEKKKLLRQEQQLRGESADKSTVLKVKRMTGLETSTSLVLIYSLPNTQSSQERGLDSRKSSSPGKSCKTGGEDKSSSCSQSETSNPGKREGGGLGTVLYALVDGRVMKTSEAPDHLVPGARPVTKKIKHLITQLVKASKSKDKRKQSQGSTGHHQVCNLSGKSSGSHLGSTEKLKNLQELLQFNFEDDNLEEIVSVFTPQENSNLQLDEEDREVEEFKMFCANSKLQKNRTKIELDMSHFSRKN